MRKIRKYLKIWWLYSRNAFISVFYAKLALIIFLFGKTVRFLFFLGFLYFLLKGSGSLVGYNINQAIFFFLTFNLIDITSQFLFREVYRFRPQIVSGDFDITLTKPISALFRSLMGGADVMDLITIPPLIFAILYVGSLLNPTPFNILMYVLLLINGMIISTALHIIVLSIGIIALEVDHLIMIYRDIMALSRVPVDIYRFPVSWVLTYLIPVGIMVTLPAKTLMGLMSPVWVLVAFLVGIIAIFAAIRFWKFSLKFYTSASS